MWLQCTTVTMLGRTASMRLPKNPETFPKGSDPDKPEVERRDGSRCFQFTIAEEPISFRSFFVTILNSAMAPGYWQSWRIPEQRIGSDCHVWSIFFAPCITDRTRLMHFKYIGRLHVLCTCLHIEWLQYVRGQRWWQWIYRGMMRDKADLFPSKIRCVSVWRGRKCLWLQPENEDGKKRLVL